MMVRPFGLGTQLPCGRPLISSISLLDDGAPGGFDTQFFHDDVDAEDYALVDDGILGEDPEGGDATKPEEDDLWAGTQGQLKRARPDSVHYAKKAKKVDVKRLKDNIWKGLQIQEKPDQAGEVRHGRDCMLRALVILQLTRAPT